MQEERERGVSGEESEEGGDDEQDAAKPNTNGLFSRVSYWDTLSWGE